MDIMVKQQLFIDLYSFSYIGLIWPPISQLKHTLEKTSGMLPQSWPQSKV